MISIILHKLGSMNDTKQADVFQLTLTYLNRSQVPLYQACQTGGPRAACGPIACLMRPAVTYLK
jgi:hypothetical protein